MATSARHQHDEEEESYFISMSDMMVGLVFIFVIMLVYFAMQFRQTTDELAGANETRRAILEELKERLEKSGVKVKIDTRTGVLRLPGDILFEKSRAELSPAGAAKVDLVARAMADVLPCYTFGARRTGCQPTKHRIDAIFVEGHTDIDPLAPGSRWQDNLDLSAMRATNVYRRLANAAPILVKLRNIPKSEGRPVPILSVSGYGEHRPIDDGFSEGAKTRNRRIDLRFLMATPDTSGLSGILVGGR